MAKEDLSQKQLESISHIIRFEVQAHVREHIAVELDSLRQRVVELENQAGGFLLKTELDATVVSEREAPPNARPYAVAKLVSREDTSEEGGGARSFQRMLLPERESTFSDDEDCLAQPDDSHEHDPPTSLYNYCMHCFASSSAPLSERALLYWVILFVVQFITMGAFVVINDLNNDAVGMILPSDRDIAPGRCMLQGQSLAGVPIIQYGMGYVSLFLVAQAIKADDLESLMAVLPNRDSGILIWCISRFAWFWQTVYVPGCFAIEVATMFAGATDASTVVMNTLAATFIMEIDNMLYNNMLSERQKAIYQDIAGSQMREELAFVSWTHPCARAMFVLNMSLMILVYSFLEHAYGEAKLYGEAYLAWYWKLLLLLYPLVYSGRFFIQYLLSHPVKAERFSTGRCIYFFPVALAGAALGLACYMSSIVFVTGRLPAHLWPPQPYVASEFFPCLPQMATPGMR